MPDYSKGIIYKIISESNPELVYYGSTIRKIERRFKGHKDDYKYWLKYKKNYTTSFEIIKLGDSKIELIENYPCDSKKELERREGYFHRNFECVNNRIAGRTDTEYYLDNKEKINKYSKKYNKIYYNNNKEKEIIRAKVYSKNNRDKINLNRRKKKAWENISNEFLGILYVVD